MKNNIKNLDTWIQQAAKKDPVQALKIVIEISEYVLPKLARIETDLMASKEDALKTEIRLAFDKLFPDAPNN